MSHKSKQYLTNPKYRLLYQSWGSIALTPPLWWFSCPLASCPVTMEAAAKEKLPEIFKGNPSEAEHFIYQFTTYFMAQDNELVIASPVVRVALILSCIKGEEVDQWVNQHLQWLELQDWQDLKVGSTFVKAFFEQFVPKGRWQSTTKIEMKWPHINEYISNFKKTHVYSKQPLKGINQVQQFIKGLAGSVKRAMMDKF